MMIGWIIGTNSTVQIILASLRSGAALPGANGPALLVNAATLTYPLSDWVAVQQRFRPDNDGSTGTFTRNWSTGSDRKIPWPVKAAGTLFTQTLAAVAVGVAVLSDATIFLKTMAATAVGVATLTKVLTFSQILAAVAVGVATLTRVATYQRALDAVAVGVAAIGRTISMTLAATAVGVASLTKVATYPRTLAATAVGVATVSMARTVVQTLAAVAVGVASLATLFIPGGGGGPAERSGFLKRFVRRITRR